MSGGFFRGTSADQDTRFSNKQAKLMKSQKFPAELEHLVDMSKVKMDVMRPWIATRVTEFLGFEDEVLINFIYGLLDGKVVNGKEVQISLTGFMEKNTGKFMKELWTLLLSAQKNASGVPQQFLDAKEEETRKKKVETDRIASEIQKKKDKEREDRELEHERSRKMDGEADMSNHVTSEPSSKHQLRPSLVHGENEKDANGRNGSRARNRVSRSPHSADHSSLSPRNRRSRSKSISNSRSYSGGRRKSRSPSESPQPRRRSLSSRSVSRSPRKRSLSPRRKPSPRRYVSPSRNRYVRRRSRSPFRRSLRSPLKRRSRTPIRRRSRSPLRRRSRSPVSRSPVRRRSRSPVSRSPVRRRSRSPVSQSPIRRRSPSPVRRRSPIPVRRRSPSPIRRRRSPSPVRRRYRRSPFSPRRRSPSPIRRSPILSRRRSPIPRRHRSPSPDERSSPSPVRRLPPSPGRRYSPLRRRSPVLSPRERIRHYEKRSPVRHARRREDDENSDESPKGADSLLHQPPTSLRSPQRDPRDPDDISKRTSSSSPSPHRSPSLSESPPASRRSPINDGRSNSPLLNRQTKSMKSQDVNASSPGKSRDQKLRHDSPKISEQEKVTNYDRDTHDQKRKPSGKRSGYSSSARESTNLTVSDKNAYSPERAGDVELLSGHDGVRIKDQEPRSEKKYGKVSEVSDQQELQTIQKDSSVGGRNREYPEKAHRDDEKQRSRLDEGKGRKRLLEIETTRKTTERDEKKDKSGSVSSSSLESEKRKHKRSKRREEASMDSYDSEIDDKKDSKKRKEEKRLRKEERRRRREERRRRREERRADKLKTKSMDKNSLSSDYEMHRDDNASDGERNVKMLSGASDAEEAESKQKQLEIELRKRALESLKAKKSINR